MNTTKFTYWLVLALAMTFTATGCKHKPVDVTNLPGRTGKPVPDIPPAPRVNPDQNPFGKDGPIRTSTRGAHDGWAENPDIFKADTVHFDFDSAAVKNSEKSKVQAVAAHLKGDPSSAVRIEGNCDERGTEEYNRSLGERRALALREELVRSLGIDPDRVDTLSYGEDRPIATGHDESAWKQNRRGEFILLTPPK
jgi:peptidoglycan-associated lipoprotein